MDGGLLVGGILILWAVAFSLLYLSLWLEERREKQREKQLAMRLKGGV